METFTYFQGITKYIAGSSQRLHGFKADYLVYLEMYIITGCQLLTSFLLIAY